MAGFPSGMAGSLLCSYGECTDLFIAGNGTIRCERNEFKSLAASL